jgi:filamentous hemagglutinin family protein
MTSRRTLNHRAKAASRKQVASLRSGLHHVLSGPRSSLLMTSVAVTALCLGMNVAQAGGPALPTGGSVTAGQATIGAPAGNSMTINQSSRSAIINWNTFSVGNGAAVNFNNGSGATLNRVTGNVPSQLDGSLTATGSLYLVNPAGVVVGTTGRISTGGSFIASTQDVSDADFMAGKAMTFKGTSQAAIVNYGKVGSLGGDVALIARQVTNNGTINARNGTVALTAGYEVLMNDATLSDGKFQVKVGGSDTAAGTAGVIRAANVELKANGGNVYALAGNTRSITKATGLYTSGGRIVFNAGSSGTVNVAQNLVARRHVATADGKRVKQGGDVDIEGGKVTLSAKIDASGKNAAGGTVVVTGADVTLASTAAIDASGTSGGTILIGGDRKGGADQSLKFLGRSVFDATTTTIANGATLSANGTNGNGGNIVVWSNDHTDYAGAISATATNGNGGFAEVSSHGVLDFTGTADLKSVNGATGTLLLDPFSVEIDATGDNNSTNTGGTFSPNGATSVISVSTLLAALANGNVIVTTGGDAGAGAGDITVNSAISWSNAHGLTLSAFHDVLVNANISGSGAIVLRADNSGTGSGTVTYGSGATVTSSSGVNVYYNPTNSAPGTVNATEYTAATQTAYAGATAWMLVNNIYDLQNMKNNGSANYALGKDIDASDTDGVLNPGLAAWTANGGTSIGFTSVGFAGNFDGLNNIIRGLTSTAGVGLFGTVSGGSIENVGLVGGSMSGSGAGVGSLIGLIGGSVTVSNVFAQNFNVTNTNTGSAGLNPLNGVPAAGGLIGGIGNNSGTTTITNAYTSGGTVTNFNVAGGLVGAINLVNGSSTSYTISQSFSDDAVTSAGIKSTWLFGGFGGLIGLLEGSSTNARKFHLNDSYATGTVTGTRFLGGLIGGVGGGGSFTISNTYASGLIVDTSGATPGDVGGLVGSTSPSTGSFAASVNAQNSYWDTATTGQANSRAGIGLNATDSLDPTKYVGFDFANVWAPPTTNGMSYSGTTGIITTGLSFLPALRNVSHVVVIETPNVNVAQGGTIPPLTGTASGTQSGDKIAGNLGLSLLDSSGQPVVGMPDTSQTGSFTITASPTIAYGRAAYTPDYRIVVETPGGTSTTPPTTPTLTIASAIGVTYSFGATNNSTYGQTSAANLGAATLAGLLPADVGNIGYVVGIFNASGQQVASSSDPAALLAVLSAGNYSERVTSLTGADAGLYSLTDAGSVTGTLSVAKAILTITTQGTVAGTRVYNGTSNISVTDNGSISGVVGTDDVHLGLGAQYGDKNVGTGKSVNGTYSLTGTASSNYQLATNTFSTTADITQATLTIANAGTVANKVYDGTTNASFTGATFTGLLGSDQVTLGLSGGFADKNVGNGKTVNGTYALSGADANNYTLAGGGSFSGTANITKATLTINAATDTKTYDGSASSSVVLGSTNVTGLVGGDTISGLTQAFDSKNAGSRTLSIQSGFTVSDGNSGGNYNVVTNTATGTINKATLTIATAGAVSDKVYDSTTAATVTSNGALGGVISGDTVNLGLSAAFIDKNAGNSKAVSGTYSLSGTDAGNYQFAGGVTTAFSGTAKISQASLTIANAGTVANKVYDGTTNASFTGATFTGLRGSDQVTLGLSGGFADKNVGNGKTVSGTYALSGADANNYTLAGGGSFSGTANITKATLTINAATDTKTYDGSTSSSVVLGSSNVTGLVGGDTISGLTQAFDSKNAGSRTLSVQGGFTVSDGNGGGNYNVVTNTAIGTINKATLTIATAGAVSDKVYDSTTAATVTSNGALGGVISGDTVNLGLSAAFTDKNAGNSKAVTGTYSLSGTDAGNYQFAGGATTAFSGTAKISQASLTIANAGTVANKVYDGTTNASITGATFTGLLGSDQVTLGLSGGFADKNVGQGKSVTGSYALSGSDAGNYVLSGATAFTGSAAITPATLTYVANAASVQSGTTFPTLGGTVSGFVGGDTLASATRGSAAWATTADTSSAAGSYAITGSGLTADNGNYVFVQAAGNATALTITAPPATGGNGGGSTGPLTPDQAVAQSGTLNPILIEPGSAQSSLVTGNTGQTNSSAAFWSYSTSQSFTGGGGNGGGGGSQGGGSTGTAPGGANNPGTVYPGNANFGRWLHFVSR